MAHASSRWRAWRAFFEHRADRTAPHLKRDHDYWRLPPSLARSLAVFQLGESGGGTVVEQARRTGLPGVDEDYVAALELFVAEEHRHAAMLASCVRGIGGELLTTNWTDRLFVFGRRLLGLRLKVAVLLCAEVVGIVYYRALAERLPPGHMRELLLELVADERSHLVFHCDFLNSQVRSGVDRLLFRCAWPVLIAVVGRVVLFDHRDVLRDLYITPRNVLRAWSRESERIVGHVLGAGREEASIASR